MKKQEIIKDIKSTFGGKGFLTMGEIAQYTDRGINDVKRYMNGYEYQTKGKAKLFYIGDVAERMLKDRAVQVCGRA